MLDNSILRGYTSETAVFQVPLNISDERIRFNADKYKRKFGHNLEGRGFTILAMSEPRRDNRPHVQCPPDRTQYAILALIRRRPVTHTIDVPDSLVPEMLALGLKEK